MVREPQYHAPYVDESDLEEMIVQEEYYVFPDTTMTVCNLKLRCGFCVIGTSACINKMNFDEDYGRHLAREDAKRKLWELEGYRIKRNRGLAK